jgi:hypothetical protein
LVPKNKVSQPAAMPAIGTARRERIRSVC